MDLKRFNELTPRQRVFTQWLALPDEMKDPPTQREYAKRVGVSEVSLSNWKSKYGLKELAGEIARDSLGEYLPGIYKALGTGAVKGELGKIKLALELVGHYVERRHNTNESTVNVNRNPGTADEIREIDSHIADLEAEIAREEAMGVKESEV